VRDPTRLGVQMIELLTAIIKAALIDKTGGPDDDHGE